MRAVMRASLAMVMVLTACGKTQTDEFTDAPPDIDGVALTVSDDAHEATSSSLENASLEAAVAPADAPPEFLAAARAELQQINDRLRAVLDRLRSVVENGSHVEGPVPNSRLYGPFTQGSVQYQLLIVRVRADVFAWKLQAAAAGVDNPEWQRLMAGFVTRGTEPRRGRGSLGLDLDVLARLDSDFHGGGELLGAYAHSALGTTLAYRLIAFTPDAETFEPLTAAFLGHRAPNGVVRVRLAGHFNLARSATSAKELVRLRVRNQRGVGGRADLLATQGDVPADKIWLASACWNPSEGQVFEIVRECDRALPVSCTVLFQEGNRDDCPLAMRLEETPPEDMGDATPEADSPSTDVTPPATMPSGEDAQF